MRSCRSGVGAVATCASFECGTLWPACMHVLYERGTGCLEILANVLYASVLCIQPHVVSSCSESQVCRVLYARRTRRLISWTPYCMQVFLMCSAARYPVAAPVNNETKCCASCMSGGWLDILANVLHAASVFVLSRTESCCSASVIDCCSSCRSVQQQIDLDLYS